MPRVNRRKKVRPIPDTIQKVRSAIYYINVVGRSGPKILRLIVPVVSAVATVAKELRRKN
jgi:hypothetical protein